MHLLNLILLICFFSRMKPYCLLFVILIQAQLPQYLEDFVVRLLTNIWKMIPRFLHKKVSKYLVLRDNFRVTKKFLITNSTVSSLMNWIFSQFELDFSAYCSLQNSSFNKTKNPVHQTRYFKLENFKNAVPILKVAQCILSVSCHTKWNAHLLNLHIVRNLACIVECSRLWRITKNSLHNEAYMETSKFHAIIFPIATASNYLWSSVACENQSF